MIVSAPLITRIVVAADFLEENGFLEVAAMLRLQAKDCESLNKSLPVRIRKCMYRLKADAPEGLSRFSAQEILEVKNVGPTTLRQIRFLLMESGLSLKGEPAPGPTT